MAVRAPYAAAPPGADLPPPERPRPRRTLALAVAVLVVGAVLLALALASRPSAPAPPPGIPIVAPTPGVVPAPGGTGAGAGAAASPAATAAGVGVGVGAGAGAGAAIVDTRPRTEQRLDLARFRRRSPTHVPARWVAGFYPLYDAAGRALGVNWLLIASIHRQETSFSTEPDTYHGLNSAGCCGGPMQFNVTNGPVTTWAQVSDAYRSAARPAGYPHPTAAHPSIYDDFDAIMGAARLLAADGATLALDGGAWQAAYGYYGHDATGVTYADQVLARAISWSQRGFCINCALDPSMVAAVDAAYGAPVLADLRAAAAARKQAAALKRSAKRP